MRQMEFTVLLKELILLFKPHTYMELGVRSGHTFNYVAPFVERAVACDCGSMNKIASPSSVVEHYNMTTDELAKIWKDPIDFLFIDADHNYLQVMKDFQNFSKFVRQNTGLIFMHDTYPINAKLCGDGYCSDAWKAAKYIRGNWSKCYEIITLPGPYAGMSIIRKATKQLGWRED